MEKLNNQKLHILLTDDDPDDQGLFREAVNAVNNHIQLTIVCDCEELTNALKKGVKPDVIFLDMNLPVRNGIDCLKVIRTELKSEVPTVIYSTSRSPVHVEECFNLGANYYIVKPASFEAIINIVKEVIKKLHAKNLRPAKEHFLLSI